MINSVNLVYLGLREIAKSVLCKFAAKQRSDRRNKVVLARARIMINIHNLGNVLILSAKPCANHFQLFKCNIHVFKKLLLEAVWCAEKIMDIEGLSSGEATQGLA